MFYEFGREYRIFLRREQDRIIVLDIARRSQLEALKPRLMEENPTP